jgi:transposase
MHPDSLRNWIRKYKSPQAEFEAKVSQEAQDEIKRLQKELKRVTEERDILKKAAAYFASNPN